MDNDRYDKEHQHGKVTFYLSDYSIDEQQSRLLMLKVLEQSVRDYCSLHSNTSQKDQHNYETAYGFLFENDYKINWGDEEIDLEQFLEQLDLDIDWVREQTRAQFKARNPEWQKERKPSKTKR